MTTSDSSMAWTPPARPDWLKTFNGHGAGLDIKSVVPLTTENLIETAQLRTGLSDFGDDDWREPFSVLVTSLEQEAELNLMGRILTRADLLRTLEGRLQIEAAYQNNPEIEQQEIGTPLIITGAARTGTSALYNLLAADPANRAPLLWETWFPSPAPEQHSYETDPRIARADHIAKIWDAIEPTFPLLHEQHATLPVEDNYLLMYSLRGPNAWLGKTPSYIQWLATADLKPSMDYAKRVLKYLQWKYQCERWVLKSPALTVPVTTWFEAFPDAMMVYTHRDPVKLTASSSNLLNTVFWLRSDAYQSHQDFYKIITNDETIAAHKNATIDLIESGAVPGKQIKHVLYKDFVEDNLQTVKSIYEYFGIQASEASFKAMKQYAQADAEKRALQPRYQYVVPRGDEITQLRSLYGKYQNYFQIPNEI